MTGPAALHISHTRGWSWRSAAAPGSQGRAAPALRELTLQGQDRQFTKTRWNRRQRNRKQGDRREGSFADSGREGGNLSQDLTEATGEASVPEGTTGQTREDAILPRTVCHLFYESAHLLCARSRPEAGPPEHHGQSGHPPSSPHVLLQSLQASSWWGSFTCAVGPMMSWG